MSAEGELFDRLNAVGGDLLQIVYRTAKDVPTAAIIVVKGIPETGAILDAVDEVSENDWEGLAENIDQEVGG